jgi:hypothetical protein
MKGDKYFLKQGKTEIVCDGTSVYRFDGEKTITKSLLKKAARPSARKNCWPVITAKTLPTNSYHQPALSTKLN